MEELRTIKQRKAEKHGVKDAVVAKIKNEAFWLHDTGAVFPERLIEFDFEYKFQYAFR